MRWINNLLADVIVNRKTNFLFFLLVLTLLAVYMMYANMPLYAGDDFFHHWGRLNGLTEALRNGTFPWYVNYNGLGGKGYFVKAFYSDLTLLPFAVVGLFTSGMVAYQSMLLGTTLLCGVVTYYCLYKIYHNPLIAFLSGILYTFSTYRLFDMYVRAAIGEVFAFIFLPIVLWGFYEIIKGDYKKWYILAIGYSLVIYSHLISAIILIIPISFFLVIYYKDFWQQKKRIYSLLLAGVVTFLLSVYYLVPLWEQMASNTFYYQTRGLILNGLAMALKVWTLPEILLQVPMLQGNPYAIKIGLILTIVIALRIFVRSRSGLVKSADRFAIVGLILVLMTTNIFPWKFFPFTLFSVMQFSFRLLIFPSLLFAVAGSIYISQWRLSVNKTVLMVVVLLTATFILVDGEGRNYLVKSEQEFENPPHYTRGNTQNMAYGRCEYLPHNVPSLEYIVYGARGNTKYSDTKIIDYKNDKGVVSFYANIPREEQIELPVIYYKGYKAALNGNEIEAKQNINGMIELDIKESGVVLTYYNGTLIQKVSTIISLITFIVLSIFIVAHRKKTQTVSEK